MKSYFYRILAILRAVFIIVGIAVAQIRPYAGLGYYYFQPYLYVGAFLMVFGGILIIAALII